MMFFGCMLAVSAFLFTRIDPTQQLVPEDKSAPVPAAAR
jgi:hypothetical protein